MVEEFKGDRTVDGIKGFLSAFFAYYYAFLIFSLFFVFYKENHHLFQSIHLKSKQLLRRTKSHSSYSTIIIIIIQLIS